MFRMFDASSVPETSILTLVLFDAMFTSAVDNRVE